MGASRNKGIMGGTRRLRGIDGSRVNTGGVSGHCLGGCNLVGSWGVVGESGDMARVNTVMFWAGDLGASRGRWRINARIRKTGSSGLRRFGYEAIEYLNGLGEYQLLPRLRPASSLVGPDYTDPVGEGDGAHCG